MKPDDILNAIGEVDEKYVRRAHMKDRIKAVFASAFTLVILIVATGFMMQPDYVLTRITSDFEINTGYVDPAHLVNDKWTTMVQTRYHDGVEVSKETFKRALYGNYNITYTPSCGNAIVLAGDVQGEHYRSEYLGRIDENNLYIESFYNEDLIGRVNFIVIHGKQSYETGEQLLNMLELEYSGSEFLVKQTKRTDDQILGYRTLDYVNHRISATKDYDASGQLLGYTTYTWDGYMCNTVSYDATDNALGSTASKYDWFGRIKNRERYDAAGNLVGKEVYHYRIWERYRGIEGILTLIAIISLAATMGIGVYEDRIKFPRKTNSEEYNTSLITGQKKTTEEKVEEVSAAIMELETVLVDMDDSTRESILDRFYSDINTLRNRMSIAHGEETQDS